MSIDTKSVLKARVTEFSPELQRLKKIDNLITDTSDGMSDLQEFEITTISLYRAFNKNIIPIPATIDFLDNLKNLRASKDRKGRQEFVTVLKNRPIYSVGGLPSLEEQQQNRPGILSRIFGFMKGKRQEPRPD